MQQSKMLPEQLFSPLFFSAFPEITALWFFGSRAKNTHVRVDSDYDFAVLTLPGTNTAVLNHLGDTLRRTLGTDLIDLVHLNSSNNPILCFEAVNGMLLFQSNPEVTASFCSIIAREYESSMALLEDGLKWWKKSRAS